MSTLTGKVVTDLASDYPGLPAYAIASAFGVVTGCIILLLGILRFGWIIDLIPLVSLSAFVTGSAITIGVTQLPSLFGVTGVSTRHAPYRVIIDTLQNLPSSKMDAAVGITALFFLYLIRFSCQLIAKRYPRRQKVIFFISTLRTVFVILFYTMVSWLANMSRRQNPRFSILMTVPTGNLRNS